jgi:hypothetical protein
VNANANDSHYSGYWRLPRRTQARAATPTPAACATAARATGAESSPHSMCRRRATHLRYHPARDHRRPIVSGHPPRRLQFRCAAASSIV